MNLLNDYSHSIPICKITSKQTIQNLLGLYLLLLQESLQSLLELKNFPFISISL